MAKHDGAVTRGQYNVDHRTERVQVAMTPDESVRLQRLANIHTRGNKGAMLRRLVEQAWEAQ